MIINLSLQAVKKIYSDERLPPPPGCPKAIYSLMIACWYIDFVNISTSFATTVH